MDDSHTTLTVTLPDLPVDILEVILLETISEEIVSNNFMRSAADENVRRLIKSLKSVCTEWNECLTSDAFELRFQRQLKKLGSFVYRDDLVLTKTIEGGLACGSGGDIYGTGILGNELFVACGYRVPTRMEENVFNLIYVSLSVEIFDLTTFDYTRNWVSEGVKYAVNMVSSRSSNCLYVLYWPPVNTRREGADEADWQARIRRIDPDGNLLNEWLIMDEVYSQNKLSATEDSTVIVALIDKNQLLEFAPDGQILRRIILQFDTSTLRTLHAIKLTSGHFAVIVNDDASDDVWCGLQVVDGDGNVVKIYRSSDTVAAVTHLEADDEGSIVVLDAVSDPVVFTPEKNRITLSSSDFEFKKELLLSDAAANMVHDRLFYCFRLDRSNGRLVLNDRNRVFIFDIKSSE